MDTFHIISVLIGSIFVSTLFIMSGRKILNCNFSKNINVVLSFVILTFSIFISSLYLDNALKMVVIYIVALFTNKMMFDKSLFQCAVTSLLSYLLLSAGEVLVAILVSIALKLELITDASTLKGHIFVNILISLSTYLFLLLFYKLIRKVVTKLDEGNKFTFIFAFGILLTLLCTLFYNLFSNDYTFNKNFILSILLIVAVSYISLIIIKQNYDKNSISNDYENYINYSKQSEKLVEQYSISQHENKNELIAIRSMVFKSNKKLLEYLDEIINNKDNIEHAWIRYLRHIPFGGLKGIMHNKVSEMMDSDIKVFLNISNEVGKSSLRKLSVKENNQLSKIIGVFLDNAMESAILSDKKEVSINIFLDGSIVVFEIANTYKEKIEIDKIYESRYTSKGKNRGYGLTLVKNIVDKSNKITNETKIDNEYFIQILKINN